MKNEEKLRLERSHSLTVGRTIFTVPLMFTVTHKLDADPFSMQTFNLILLCVLTSSLAEYPAILHRYTTSLLQLVESDHAAGVQTTRSALLYRRPGSRHNGVIIHRVYTQTKRSLFTATVTCFCRCWFFFPPLLRFGTEATSSCFCMMRTVRFCCSGSERLSCLEV